MGRPDDVWTVPVVLTDLYDGKPVTLYTYPSSYAGAAFNQNQVLNAPSDKPDYYHSFELTANKRFSKRWNMSSSFWVTKTHEWIRATPTSPNDNVFPLNDTWGWEARADANYRLPAISISPSTCGPHRGPRDRGPRPSLTRGCSRARSPCAWRNLAQNKGPVVPVTSLRVAKKFRASCEERAWT